MRLLLLTWLFAGWARGATPPSVQECVAASGAGQEHLKQGALFSARRELELCAADSCPAVVSADCTRWLEEAIAAMPSVNIVVRVNEVDQSEAMVRLDGAPWLERLTGRPQDVEPGAHEFEVEFGGVRQSKRLVIVQGERNRVVTFHLTIAAPPVIAEVKPVTPPEVPPPVVESKHTMTWPLVFTAAAAAGAISFTIFGLSGKGRLETLLMQPCAATKTCDPAEPAAITREFIAADVSLGLGIASAITAGALWWWWSNQPEAKQLTVIPAGTSLQLVGAF